MKLYYIVLCCMFTCSYSLAQHNLNIYIKDATKKEPIAGVVVNIPGTAVGNTTDENGFTMLTSIPSSKQIVLFTINGFRTITDTLTFPLAGEDTLQVYMEEIEEELEETTVSATRSSRTIKDIPTRIELISGEELEEKANMKPGDIRMMLSESTGIQTLQTSATSSNTSIRIQGMDGRYTQILKDGLPLYAGFSGGLGLLQTPPLNLKRVEIVKGASSTLYGGGAIAGLINLVSKTPTENRELRFLLNGTSAKGIDVNTFYSQRFKKTGVTLYAAWDANSAYAPAGTPFTAIPKFTRYTFSPKLFLYLSGKDELSIGINTALEERTGGDIRLLNRTGDSSNTYFEENKTERVSSEIEYTHKFTSANSLKIKNSLSQFSRRISSPGYLFDGTQTSSFTEVSYSSATEKSEWIAGGNLFTDAFNERNTTTPLRNYQLSTIGAFVQNTWNISRQLILETGLRGDHVNNYGAVLLPRLSLLYKVTSKLSSRIGGGMGYKAPTIFTEESERLIYRNVLPVSTATNKLEHSVGGNWDVNYKTLFANGLGFSVNQLVFYTRIDDPLILARTSATTYLFTNTTGHIDAKGTETNIKLSYHNFKLFLGYTITHSHLHIGSSISETPLTPRHRTNSVLMYEIEAKWKIGLEAYYFSPQKLSDNTTGRDYWLCGFMAERIWKKFSVFINFENMLDSRQTRFDTIYSGTLTNPVFRDLYAPLEGFVVNGGLKLNL